MHYIKSVYVKDFKKIHYFQQDILNEISKETGVIEKISVLPNTDNNSKYNYLISIVYSAPSTHHLPSKYSSGYFEDSSDYSSVCTCSEDYVFSDNANRDWF